MSGAWTACDGGVGPRVELCDGLDDDCDGTPDGAMASCPAVPHASAICASGSCEIASCEVDWADCDGDASNGCEGRAGACCPVDCAWGCTGATCHAATSVTVGLDFACVLRDDGRVACWGANGWGQLGDGTGEPHRLPAVVPGLSDVTRVVAGFQTVCAIWGGGRLSCWGRNASADLGFGYGLDDVTTPREHTFPLSVVDVSLGIEFTCVALSDGRVQCAGQNSFGQLGDGTTVARPTFTATADVTDVVALTTYDSHTCALRRDSHVSCWGYCALHKCGVGDSGSVRRPLEMVGVTNVAIVVTGDDHTCVSFTDGTMACVGVNGLGEIGIGTTDTPIRTAVVTPGVSSVAFPFAFRASFAMTLSGEAWKWGSADLRGDTMTAGILSPVRAPNLDGMTQIDSGGRAACGVRDGAVFCWGQGSLLADGVFLRSPTPVRVLPP
ncbi:MAG: hypothetical protein J0L92_24645 [Deltaproteobacteria bacterium]|nr:hypothetical protein [Deltaproteobacteria bacterium]